MKFTQEQFSEALRAKLTNGGKKTMQQSERSFNGFVGRTYKRLEKHDGEIELDDAVVEYISDLEEYEGDFRKNNSDFVKKENDLKTEIEKLKGSSKDTDDKYEQLITQLEEFKAERAKEKAEKVVVDKRKELKVALKAKDVKNAEWIDDQLDLIAITAESDINELTEKLVNSYNKFASSTPLNVTPGGAGGGEPQKEDFSDIVALVKRQDNRE